MRFCFNNFLINNQEAERLQKEVESETKISTELRDHIEQLKEKHSKFESENRLKQSELQNHSVDLNKEISNITSTLTFTQEQLENKSHELLKMR